MYGTNLQKIPLIFRLSEIGVEQILVILLDNFIILWITVYYNVAFTYTEPNTHIEKSSFNVE